MRVGREGRRTWLGQVGAIGLLRIGAATPTRRGWAAAAGLVGLGGSVGHVRAAPATAATRTGTGAQRPQGLDAVSSGDAALAVRQALERGCSNALNQLGVSGGFAANERLRLGLPDSLRQGERLLRLAGRGGDLDSLVDAMNRAAEQSMPIMRPQVTKAVRGLGIADAKALLTGGEDALTEHLRESAGPALAARWLPTVDGLLKKLGALGLYQGLAEKAGVIGLDRGEGASIQEYVAGRAQAGFFSVVADQERQVRLEPASFGSKAVTRVFGAMR